MGRERRTRRRTREKAGARAGRRERRVETPLLKLPFRQLTNPLPPLEMVSAEQVERLHLASLEILENVGLDFLDDEALEIWRSAGARVDDRARHVWMDRGLVMEAVAKAPETFTWHARNPAHDVRIGGNAVCFATHAGMAYATDMDNGRRPGTLRDLENLVKLAQMCNVLHFPSGGVVEPQDIPVSTRHLRRTYAALKYSDKPVRAAAHGRVITADDIEMVRLAFGGDLSGKPVLGSVVNVNSPLRYDGRMLGGLITYARHGQVSIITPFILIGAMSPITLAAALAQQNAEVLAGVALAQLVNPGAPVIYGGFTTNVDMRSGSPAFGTPEGAWATIVGAQMARYYRLPYRSSGSLNTAKVPDAQAAYETQWTLWPAVLSHTNFVNHAAGWLESGLTVSYEKFIIDVESLAMFYHFLEGFPIDDESLALDMIAEVGPGGHHFGTAHTQERFDKEFYEPILSDRLAYEPWEAAGSWDVAKRAHELWKSLLARYEAPAIDPAIDEALQEYVARRSAELEGVELYG